MTASANLLNIQDIRVCRLFQEQQFSLWNDVKMFRARVSSYKLIILHIGTNDLESRSSQDILTLYHDLLAVIRSQNKQTKIAFSAIIPRPKDTAAQDEVRQEVNAGLKRLALSENCFFLSTWRPFITKDKTVNKSLFSSDGLHLNFKGTYIMNKFMDGTVNCLLSKLDWNII